MPLPSSAPASRTQTSESGTDVMGPEDLTVSLSSEPGVGVGIASSGGEGLRWRGGTAGRSGEAAGGSGAAGVGFLGGGGGDGGGGGSGEGSGASSFRRVYTGRSLGRLERIKAAKAARAVAAAASEKPGGAPIGASASPASPGSPASTIGLVRAVCEDEEGHSAGDEEGEEQRWAEEVARDREGASGGPGCPAALPPSPLDADARALHKVLLRLGLEGYFAALRAEALASLSLLQDLATSDADALRKVLREAGIGRVGHREALVLALTRGGKGAAAAPPGQGGAAAAGGGAGGGCSRGSRSRAAQSFLG